MEKYLFQYCPKIVIFSKDKKSILLCKRKGERDYDGVFSFIGGKMETSDATLIDAIKLEKDEEVGKGFHISLYPTFYLPVLFRKKDGHAMIVPHYFALYINGEVVLNSEEYSEYTWVKISTLNSFEPKIADIPGITKQLLHLKTIMKKGEFVTV